MERVGSIEGNCLEFNHGTNIECYVILTDYKTSLGFGSKMGIIILLTWRGLNESIC